jgi:hypothetical protein
MLLAALAGLAGACQTGRSAAPPGDAATDAPPGIHAGDGTVRGRVEISGGPFMAARHDPRPAPDTLLALRPGTDGDPVAYLRSDSRGRFSLRLLAGCYRITAAGYPAAGASRFHVTKGATTPVVVQLSVK